MEYLTLEDVLGPMEDLGVGPIGDIGLLDFAVHRPRVSVFGDDACRHELGSPTGVPWSHDETS